MAQPDVRRTATIIWAALLGGPTLLLGVTLYVVVGTRGGVGLAAPFHAELVLIGVSLALSVATVAVSWLWAVRMARPAQGGVTLRSGAILTGPEATALTRLIVASALCEGSALFAAIAFLLTGRALALAPYAISWIALAAHFPGDRHWARLSGLPAGAESNRMIRS